MDGEKPIVPLYGRYPSKEMKELFPLDEQRDYRHQSSPEMRNIFSDNAKYLAWRRNWVILAEAEQILGLNIPQAKLEALKKSEKNINFEAAKDYEKKLKHDVMAYMKEFGDRADEICPGASGILHMGATSCYITDHEELLAMYKGLVLVKEKAQQIYEQTKAEALKPALAELEHRIASLKARGTKGTTGTQASYLSLFGGDHEKVIALDELVSKMIGFRESYTITSQTYPRIVDYQVLSSLSVLAYALYLVNEDYGADTKEQRRQAIEIMEKAKQAGTMASSQWLERSLDDSSERRIILTESFYQTDCMLNNLLGQGINERDKSINSCSEKDFSSEKKALEIIKNKLANSVCKIYEFAEMHRNTVCTAFTHGQFAQPTTYGKRISLWAYNLVLALKDIEQAKLSKTHDLGYSEVQQYLLSTRLSQVAIAAAKAALDIRLLQHDLEVNEPFGVSQVGSSAMPYKKNPMKCERTNGLARHLIGSMTFTPDKFRYLNADAILELVLSIFVKDNEKQKGFTVHPLKAEANLVNHMPFLASEELLMQATNAGGNRQELHELIRLASLEATENINAGRENNILEKLAEKGFNIDLANKEELLDPERYVGRSREQTDDFGRLEVDPIRERYNESLGIEGKVQV